MELVTMPSALTGSFNKKMHPCIEILLGILQTCGMILSIKNKVKYIKKARQEEISI